MIRGQKKRKRRGKREKERKRKGTEVSRNEG